MLIIDKQHSAARLSLAEITAPGRGYVSDPDAFAGFVTGLKLESWIIAEPAWRTAPGRAGAPYFATLMHGAVPRFYDAAHLETLGGRFALRIAGLNGRGDFTVTVMNRRVLTLSGLPHDAETGQPVIDAEIRAEAFLALCNDLLAELAQTTLDRLAMARAARAQAA